MKKIPTLYSLATFMKNVSYVRLISQISCEVGLFNFYPLETVLIIYTAAKL